MTNTNQENQKQEEICSICKAYGFFKHLLHDSELTMEEAFHEAVGFALSETLDEVIEEVAEDHYNEGFKDGTSATYRRLAENLNEIAANIESDNTSCDDCDCGNQDECVR